MAWRRRAADAEVYLGAPVVGELRQGIERLRLRDRTRAEALDRWLSSLVAEYRERILPVTRDVAEQWGRLSLPPNPPPVIDGLLAATALVHRLTLVARNVGDVARTGVRVVNPFEPA